MKQLATTFAALFAAGLTACVGAIDENPTQDAIGGEVASTAAALTDECQINPDGTAFCAPTAIAAVLGRNVYYRIGASAAPGYDSATGRHSAVVLFQGTSMDPGPDNGGGGSNGPGATWSASFTKPGSFGVWHQVATIVALVNAGYTVIQPPARYQCIPNTNMCGYFWDSNIPGLWGDTPGSDKPLVSALIAQLQPGATTFGAVDIHHVYATGISSGGYMTSRMVNEFAGGVNNDSTVKSTTLPFRAGAIESGSFQTCGPACLPIAIRPVATTHAPTFFLHDMADQVVPFGGMKNYYDKLNSLFRNNNPAYTVNGVRQQFTLLDTFTGDAPPSPGHQWSSKLTADSGNLILKWFNSHR
jgi:hypothetical protein